MYGEEYVTLAVPTWLALNVVFGLSVSARLAPAFSRVAANYRAEEGCGSR